MNHDLIESIDNAEFNNEFEFEDSIKNKLLMFLKLKLKRDYFVEPENIKKIIAGIEDNEYNDRLLYFLYNYLHQRILTKKIDLNIVDDKLCILEYLQNNDIVHSKVECYNKNLLKKITVLIKNEDDKVSSIKSVAFCLDSAIDLIVLNSGNHSNYYNQDVNDIISKEIDNYCYDKIGFFNSKTYPLYNVYDLKKMSNNEMLLSCDSGLLMDSNFTDFYPLTFYTKKKLESLIQSYKFCENLKDDFFGNKIDEYSNSIFANDPDLEGFGTNLSYEHGMHYEKNI